jgi:hypothetical protein
LLSYNNRTLQLINNVGNMGKDDNLLGNAVCCIFWVIIFAIIQIFQNSNRINWDFIGRTTVVVVYGIILLILSGFIAYEFSKIFDEKPDYKFLAIFVFLILMAIPVIGLTTASNPQIVTKSVTSTISGQQNTVPVYSTPTGTPIKTKVPGTLKVTPAQGITKKGTISPQPMVQNSQQQWKPRPATYNEGEIIQQEPKNCMYSPIQALFIVSKNGDTYNVIGASKDSDVTTASTKKWYITRDDIPAEKSLAYLRREYPLSVGSDSYSTIPMKADIYDRQTGNTRFDYVRGP